MATVTDQELDDLVFDTSDAGATAAENEAVTPQPQEPPELPTRSGGPFYFDLETIPDHERIDAFGLEPLPEPVPVTPAEKMPPVAEVAAKTVSTIRWLIQMKNPSQEWLDALKAEETGGKGRKGVLDGIDAAGDGGDTVAAAIADRRKLLSTTPEYCRIAAIGWAIGNGDVVSWVATEPEHERGMLEAFWVCAKLCRPIIGFNILNFDLPVIFFRSALLKVPSSKAIDMKPWGRDVVDLYAKRFPKGNYGSGGRPGKLKELAPLAGIEVPAGDVDGSQVQELMLTEPAKVGEYVRSDVEITRQLHRFYSGYFCE